jgi:hypothetical protein
VETGIGPQQNTKAIFMNGVRSCEPGKRGCDEMVQVGYKAAHFATKKRKEPYYSAAFSRNFLIGLESGSGTRSTMVEDTS